MLLFRFTIGYVYPAVTDVMMRLRDAKTRAAPANKVVLEAEQAKDTVEQEMEDRQHALEVKRARTEPSTIEDDEGA